MTSSAAERQRALFGAHGGFLAATLAGHAPDAAALSVADGGRLSARDVGVLEYAPAGVAEGPRLLLSAGVHGNETAPMELLDALVAALVAGDLRPRCPLLLLLGNPPAIRAGRRYCDENMNRLFLPEQATEVCAERQRAALLMRHASTFLGDEGAIHLDLHTAIRGSRYRRFAICPREQPDADWVAGLGAWGIEALLCNPRTRSTFAAFSATHCGAQSFTVELGRARPFGANFPEDIAPFREGLWRYLEGGRVPKGVARAPALFDISREIIKGADSFALHLGEDCENFQPVEPGELLAREAQHEYRGDSNERILFPNAAVAIGERALLLVRPRGES